MSNDEWHAFQRAERREDLVKRKEAFTPLLRSGLIWPFPDKVEKLGNEVISNAVLGKTPNSGCKRAYLLEFRGPGQYVKVGSVEDNYRRRMKQHRRIARVHGYALVDAWISREVADERMLETAIKNHLKVDHQQHDGEYFFGLDFDEAFELAERASHR